MNLAPRNPRNWIMNYANRYANGQLWYQQRGIRARNFATGALASSAIVGRYLKAKQAKNSSKVSKRPDDSKKYIRKKPAKRITLSKATDSLKKQVRDIKRNITDTEGTLIYRLRGTSRCLASVNAMNHVMLANNTMNNYETVLAQLRFFDSATPGTLVQASGATGTYYREYLFKKVYSHHVVVNNYQVPCKCTVYLVRPKQDTTIAPITAFTDGLTDVGGPSSTSPLVHLTDSDEFNDLWKIDKSTSKILHPGQRIDMYTSDSDVLYSPATFDSHSLDYQKRFHCWAYIVRVEGVLGHDTTADEQGFLQAGVDITCDQIYTVNYDAGIDLKYIVVQNNSDTFSNGGVVSSKPVSDNIGYSVN